MPNTQTSTNLSVVSNKKTPLSTSGTQLNYSKLNASGLAINSNGALTPTGVIKSVASKIQNQRSISFKTPIPNGASVAALGRKKIKAKK